MTRKSPSVEIIVGCALVLFGLISALALFEPLNWTLRLSQKQGELAWGKAVLRSCFVVMEIVIVLSGGILLLFKKKAGWFLAMISCLFLSINWLETGLRTQTDPTASSWIQSALGLFFLGLAFILLTKPIRRTYGLKINSSFFVIIGVFALLLFRYMF